MSSIAEGNVLSAVVSLCAIMRACEGAPRFFFVVVVLPVLL